MDLMVCVLAPAGAVAHKPTGVAAPLEDIQRVLLRCPLACGTVVRSETEHLSAAQLADMRAASACTRGGYQGVLPLALRPQPWGGLALASDQSGYMAPCQSAALRPEGGVGMVPLSMPGAAVGETALGKPRRYPASSA